MQTKANIYHGQRGGSTLIGLILGLCLGMLALIQWPQLEVPIEALLAEHDIRLVAARATDSGVQRHLQMLGVVDDNSKRSVPNLISNTAVNQNKERYVGAEHFSADKSAQSLLDYEYQAAGLPDRANPADSPSSDGRWAPASVSDTGASRSTSNARTKTSASASVFDVLDQRPEWDASHYETREVWQAFSSESAAEAFATVVSNALNIEVQTIRQSDHKIVPIVRCERRGKCDAMRAEITAFLAGTVDVGVYDEL
jgi:hypothetical protein